MACRLIPLNKRPGVRPIGICEVVRRIIGKAILTVTSNDIQLAAGTLQLCAGQTTGIEAAIHAMHHIYDNKNTDALLLVDAENAFNLLNRRAALHNIKVLCPALATILQNTYGGASELFVGGEMLISDEGTTQGDPLAMSMYAVAVMPLLRRLQPTEIKQVWFADDATGGGSLVEVRSWWDQLINIGPGYGYYPKAGKSWLLVKKTKADEASRMFSETGIQITTEGRRLLGAAIGTAEFEGKFMETSISPLVHQISRLAEIAKTQPHAAHAAFMHGMKGKWTFLTRVNSNAIEYLQPLEDTIRTQLIPSLTGRTPPGSSERDLLSLPPRLGGLGLTNPTKDLSIERENSLHITAPLVQRILKQDESINDIQEQLKHRKKEAYMSKCKSQQATATKLKAELPPTLQKSVELATETGASNWLTTIPLDRYGFTLHKGAYRDALCLRYGWLPPQLPTHCVCGQSFTIDHALSCPTGGYPSIRHNELRDITAALLKEVCTDVTVEPSLQPLTGEALDMRTSIRGDEGRLDISARGFWGSRFERAFYDVRVFNPCAPSNRTQQIAATYRRHEQEKRRAYQQRVREVERASFTPLVFAARNGQGSHSLL